MEKRLWCNDGRISEAPFYTLYSPHTQRVSLSCGAFNNRGFPEATSDDSDSL
ncbi:MAG: hypothetical protein HDT08_04465 [Bacteroidales bacterium]|nr:hypothetical protein [Bacteroidales bacterium]